MSGFFTFYSLGKGEWEDGDRSYLLNTYDEEKFLVCELF